MAKNCLSEMLLKLLKKICLHNYLFIKAQLSNTQFTSVTRKLKIKHVYFKLSSNSDIFPVRAFCLQGKERNMGPD